MNKKSTSRLFILLCLVFLLAACGDKPEVNEKTDWRDRFGENNEAAITMTPDAPSGLSVPTPKPELTFVPTEDQVELVLYVDRRGDGINEDVETALNILLQKRGTNFYLNIQSENPLSISLSKWQERIDAGENIDLIAFSLEDVARTYNQYGNVSPMRAISGGYLLPFSEYPQTEAKERLLAAYPEGYWELCRVNGELYGVSGAVSRMIRYNDYVMLNLDAAQKAGITAPEQLDLANLDEMLSMAAEAGIPGIETHLSPLEICNITLLPCELYLQYQGPGDYRIVNPFHNNQVIEQWDARHRYWENGWRSKEPVEQKALPLILCVGGTAQQWNGTTFTYRTSAGELSAEMKVYDVKQKYLMEGDLRWLMGISSKSEHPEEALELLSLMHSDEEVVRLLRYGVEGINYTLEDGGKTIKMEKYTPLSSFVGNQLMYLEFEKALGLPNPEEEYMKNIAEIEKIPYLEDFSEAQQEQIKKIRAITYNTIEENGSVVGMSNNAGGIVDYYSKNYQKSFEKQKLAFEEAGYDTIAREVNLKYGLE